MWQSTISLRYVSYKNADSNLHERICAMAMMAKNLLWSCAQIVAPRPPTNTRRPNEVAPGKGGIPSVLAIERARPALPEQYLQLFIDADSMQIPLFLLGFPKFD